jgi:hypothetical protein
MTDQPLADAIECAIGLNTDCGGTEGVHRVRDAVLAAVQPYVDLDVLERVVRRARRAEAAIARVRAECALIEQDMQGSEDDGMRTALIRILAALDEPTFGPAATQATEPHTGLVVQPYRNDQGQPAWVFRCWGTDTCDGWLSLDHTSQQSAERARDRHVTEEHSKEETGA